MTQALATPSPALSASRAPTRRPRWLTTERLLSASVVVLLFAIWWLAARFAWINPIFLPGPAQVWAAFISAITTGYQGSRLHEHVLASLGRILAGYLLACLIGIPLGLFMGFSRKVRALFDPLIEFYRPLPPLALYTLLVMWLGIGDTSKVALLFTAALPPLSLSAMHAAESVEPQWIRAARSLGASRRQLLRYVILPACLPRICNGMRISLGFTYTVLVAAEIVAATAGLGWMIWDASKFLLTDVVIMGLFVLSFTGLVLDALVRWAEKRITPWRFIAR